MGFVSSQLGLGHRLAWPAIRYWLPVMVGMALLAAILLPLNLVTMQRFHHDEALYATWALDIASGKNPWLAEIPIDKPPLFLYTAAGSMWLLGATESAARLPSMLATIFTVGLTFGLGRKLYGRRVGVLATWLVALSPFTLLFAPTAFTDPLLVAWVLAGCLAAAYGRAGWAGVLMGLAIATKQQGILFVPLAALLLIAARNPQPASPFTLKPWRNFFLTTFLIIILLLVWDSTRNHLSGFWQLSLDNYGGLTGSFDGFNERWFGFMKLLRYATASPMLNVIFLAGLPLLLIHGLLQILKLRAMPRVPPQPGAPPPAHLASRPSAVLQYLYDWLLSLFILTFLIGHAWFSFQVWDRYLLGLIPFLALLLARILLLPWAIITDNWFHRHPTMLPSGRIIIGLALTLWLIITLTSPVRDAVNGRYPLGSNSKALYGIEQIVAYLQGHAGANTTLYHHWLGTHWRFYLWDYPYDLQYWESAQALAGKAQGGQLIALPTWQSETEVRLALTGAGLKLRELTRAYSSAGYPSIILYQIEPVAR